MNKKPDESNKTENHISGQRMVTVDLDPLLVLRGNSAHTKSSGQGTEKSEELPESALRIES